MTNKTTTNLAAKMVAIMGEIEVIPKNGFNQFHRYKYALEADISAALSKAMQKHKVCMLTSMLERTCIPYKTRGNKDAFLITVKIQVTFIDAETNEKFESIFYGDGSDADDKGIYKALTGAQKYALMKTFLIATGDDPENYEPHSASAEQQPQAKETFVTNSKTIEESPQTIKIKQMFALFDKIGVTRKEEILGTLSDITGRPIESSKDLTMSEIDLVLANLTKSEKNDN